MKKIIIIFMLICGTFLFTGRKVEADYNFFKNTYISNLVGYYGEVTSMVKTSDVIGGILVDVSFISLPFALPSYIQDETECSFYDSDSGFLDNVGYPASTSQGTCDLIISGKPDPEIFLDML